MNGDDTSTRPRPFRVTTLRGESYQVDGRKLTPVARVVSYGKARGTIGAEQVSGWGTGFMYVSPLAVVEERDGEESYIPISDSTGSALRGIFASTIAIVLFCTAIRWWVRRRRARV